MRNGAAADAGPVLLTLTVTGEHADDLGWLLHKRPDRVQAFDVSSGTAHVFYPEVSGDRCTAALLLEVDPVALVRGGRGRSRGVGGGDGFALGQHVNDRPYAASSLLAVALNKVFRSAMAGRSESRPDVAASALPLEVHVPALPTRGGADLVRRMFSPLGWQVDAREVPLEESRPDWGAAPYVDARLTGEVRLADALNHLYVLLPVLDQAKHYWIGDDEVDKLLRAGTSWLAGHPEQDLITRRYLRGLRSLAADATARLAEAGGDDAERASALHGPRVGQEPDRPVPLRELRHEAVLAVLREVGARRVLDLGCGDGRLLQRLVADPAFEQVTGADVSARALAVAERRLGLDRLPDARREQVRLLQSSAVHRDVRLTGYDAVTLVEVVEHVDPGRLADLARAVLGHARPSTVVVTTPNVEHNVRFEGLAPGELRHADHRFEWTRQQFQEWARQAASSYGYDVTFRPVGDDDADVGPPTQMAVLSRRAAPPPEPPDALEETAHLLRSPANARWLLESLAEARRGEVEEHPLDRG